MSYFIGFFLKNWPKSSRSPAQIFCRGNHGYHSIPSWMTVSLSPARDHVFLFFFLAPGTPFFPSSLDSLIHWTFCCYNQFRWPTSRKAAGVGTVTYKKRAPPVTWTHHDGSTSSTHEFKFDLNTEDKNTSGASICLHRGQMNVDGSRRSHGSELPMFSAHFSP